MSEVIVWACSICAGAAVCLICEMLLPNGGISKIVRFAVGIFMVAIIILPLGGIVSAVTSEINSINIKEKSFNELEEKAQSNGTSLAMEKVKALVAQQLKSIGVTPNKIEIKTDSDKLTDIKGIESVIYISEEDRGQGFKIKNTIKNNLGLDCKVLVGG
ncbi:MULTISPECIES: stage III sporulation protein AF [unclassified Ruminococcus]|uniref:stage III sporulation protein AF n=1 Tax=unclassified Ruminococcus TaxID=2608920 RepID=UPI00210EADE1|nr:MULTISPECIES: stage III sporulation protein AF [unclassified Ruminococcus]MCQ4022086.1 hypothetical protein [Ruminococcus sp. zg-924]MCQ4114406.1 hypothetical protein [Ruminococcus sp. zg-921]